MNIADNKRYQRLQSQYNQRRAIAEQLQLAEALLEQGQLSRPENNNALAKFNAVLVMDETNAQAKAGIEKILSLYQQKADAAYRKQDYAAVVAFANSGLAIESGQQALLSLRQKAQAAIKRKQQISSLIEQAQAAEEQGSYFSGQPSAIEKYQAVLALQANHHQANAAVKTLVADLNQQISELIEARDLQQAEQLLAPALEKLPNNNELLALQTKIASVQPAIEVLKLSGQPINDLLQELPEQFKAGRVLYIGFAYKNFLADTTVLQATLFDGEKTLQIAAVPVIVSGKEGNNFFKIQRPVEGFKAGGYRLEIVLADKQILSQSFVIKP